jgi:hypothetical protein
LNTVSDTNQHVKMSWRFTPASSPTSRPQKPPKWHERKNLYLSIAPGKEATIDLEAPLPKEPGPYLLEVTLLQEGVFLLQDKGMKTAYSTIDVAPDQ